MMIQFPRKGGERMSRAENSIYRMILLVVVITCPLLYDGVESRPRFLKEVNRVTRVTLSPLPAV
jgi:hypothetical protein